ncbi:MAG: hypothetical protein R2932_19650 [Caldilineaceae bacterium]
MNSISRQEFNELYEFIVCYFADYWEGRTEQDLVREAVSENASSYLNVIMQQIDKFIDSNVSLEVKKQFITNAGLYDENGTKTIERLKRIKLLIQNNLTDAEDSNS